MFFTSLAISMLSLGASFTGSIQTGTTYGLNQIINAFQMTDYQTLNFVSLSPTNENGVATFNLTGNETSGGVTTTKTYSGWLYTNTYEINGNQYYFSCTIPYINTEQNYISNINVYPYIVYAPSNQGGANFIKYSTTSINLYNNTLTNNRRCIIDLSTEYNANPDRFVYYKVGFYCTFLDNDTYTYLQNNDNASNEEVAFNNGYQSGYNDGQSEGYADGLVEGSNTGYGNGYDTGHAVGYNEGFNAGQQSGDTLRSVFFSIADVPIITMRGLFDFELFGLNMYAVIGSLVALFIGLVLVRKVF